MADDKTSKRTSESGSALKEVEHSTFSNKITEDIEIFPQRAVSDAAYFSRDFGESETNDDADNCPNFSIYSATSIDFTKSVLDNKSIQKIESPYRAGGSDEECDENLVQMTDDEDEDEPNQNNELSEHKLKIDAYSSLDEKVADVYASKDEKTEDTYASLDEKAADAYASSDEKAAETYASLDEKAADTYASLDEKAAEAYASSDEKIADAYISSDKKATDAYASLEEKAADAHASLDEKEENKDIEEIQSPSFTDQEQEYDNGNEDDKTLPEHEMSGEILQNISNSTDSTTGIKLNNLGLGKPLNAEANIVCPEPMKERVASVEQEKVPKRQRISLIPNKKVFLELYDDSDWEEWTNEKTDEEKSIRKPNTLADIEKLTESISDVEDDRGYTPCQDELIKTRSVSDEEHEITGIGGLDTELISEEEGNIFSDDLPKVQPKNKPLTESQIEDGEIIEKHKMMELDKGALDNSVESIAHKEKKSKSKDKDKENRKNKNTLPETFKKISSKDRNYRDKDKKRKTRSESREKRKYNYRKKKDRTPSRKKEKRKDLEWYDVRNMISEKKKRNDKDEYGRERRPTLSRSRSRARLRSQSRSRSRKLREIRNRSRGRSGYRRFHNSRSKSRSFSPSRSTSVERRRRKRRSRSVRRRSRSLSRTYHRNSKIKHISKSKTPVRKTKKTKRKRSRSYQRDWTPSWSSHEDSRLSNSPSNNNIGKILASPSWTPPLRENMPNAQNLTVIVSNKDAGKKKKEKRKKTELKMKETAGAEKVSKKRRRERSSEPSKEVFASGDNILVSVSFNKNKTVETHPSSQATNQSAHQVPSSDRGSGSKRSKNKNLEPSEPRKTKTSKVKDKQAKANRNRRLNMLANRKPIAIIDLDKSPFKELTPSPKAVIVLTDSDSEEKEHQSLLTRQERIHQELGSLREESQPESPAPYDNVNPFITNNTGPKTPPEPQVNFSLQLKATPKLRNVNLLYDHEDEDENGNDDMDQGRINAVSDNRVEESGTHKGPNTPPEPPNSPPSSPDAYDPFEPTKSPSQSPNIMENTPTTVADKQPAAEENNFDKQLDAAPSIISQVPPPLEDKPTETSTNTVEQVLALLAQRFNTTPEKNPGSLIQNDGQIVIGKLSDSENKGQGNVAEPKVPSPEVSKNGVTILSNVLLQPNMLTSVLKSDANLVFTSCAAPVCSTPMMTSMTPSRTNLFNSTGNNTMQNANSVTPSKSGKSQARPSPIKSNPIKPMVKTAVIKPGIRPHMTNKVHKPTDCDVESPYSPGSDDFDDLFEPPSNDANKISAKNQKTTSKSPVKKAHEFDHLFMSPSYRPSINTKAEKRIYNKKYKKKGNKTQVGVKIDEDQLKVLEELPSSAVEMQVKDKFMKKLNRQERVVEEVKVVLKPHYAKKHVTKEQYKDILRRAVPKICHNRSGEINPQRIHKLIEAYVKKARYSRKA